MSKDLLIFDPNRIDGTDSGYLDDSKLSIDVRLEAIRKEKSSIIVADGVADITGTSGDKIDFISGNRVNSNPTINSLSTLFTEANSQFDVINDGTYKNLETLGIKDINVNFSSAYTPLITMNLIDVRGRLFQEGNNSPYAVFYDIPYPIFRLTLKGFVGKSVTYDLHLTKFESTFNSDFGGFEIKCEFVGYHYAMLSDMLIGYLRGVEYTTVGMKIFSNPKFNGLKISDLREDLVVLKETFKEISLSDTQIDVNNSMNAVSHIDTLIQRVTNSYENIRTLINNGSAFINDISQLTFVCKNTDNNKTLLSGLHNNLNVLITEYNKSVIDTYKIPTYQENGKYSSIYEGKVTIELINNQNVVVSKDIHNKTLPSSDLKPQLFPVGVNQTLTVTIQFVIDKLNEVRKIAEETASIMKGESAMQFGELVNNKNLKLDIGNYFETLCNHVDVLLLSIANVSKQAMDDPERRSYFKTLVGLNGDGNTDYEKILPFPDYKVIDPSQKNAYVEQWIGKIQANGKTLPEVEFVEELMRGWIKAHRLDQEDNELFEQIVSNERYLFSPTHPIDLMMESDYNPYSSIETMTNADELIKLLMWRASLFLMTQRYEIDLGEKVLRDFITIELENMKSALNKNKDVYHLFNNSFTNGVKLDKYFKKINNGYIPTLLDKGAYSPYRDITSLNSTTDYTRKYVTGNLVRYSPTINSMDSISIGGSIYNDLTNIRKTWRPLTLGKTYIQGAPDASETPDNSFEISASSVSVNETNANVRTVKDIEFSTQKGVPLITKFNNVDSHKNFYKKSSLTPNDLIFKHDEITASIFTSDLFLCQTNNTSKAMVLLMSVPFKMQVDGVGNFSTDITRMFNVRTGIVRSSFLFTALIGGFFELFENKFKISVGETVGNKKIPYICADFDTTPITVDSNGRYYFKASDFRLPYAKNLIDSGCISFGRNESSRSIDASAFYHLFSPELRKQFVDKFYEFVKIVSTDVLPSFTNDIFINNFVNVEDRLRLYGIGRNASWGSFGETDATDTYKSGGRPLPFNDSKILNVNKYRLLTNKENNSFMDVYFFGCFDVKLIKGTKVYNTLQNLIDATVDIYNFNANFWASSPVIETNEGANSLINSNNITNFGIVLNDVLKDVSAQYKTESLDSTNTDSENLQIFQSNNSEDIRLKIYKDIKNIHDKWVLGNPDLQDIDTYKPLYDSFRFINRTYANISNDFYLNMFSTLSDLRNNLHQPLYGHISKVLATNNFLFIPMPNFVDLTNIDDLKDMFKPRYYNESEDSIKHTFVCMYVGEYSTKLDLGVNNRFRSDGIEISNTDGTYNISAVDYVEGTDSPIIIARFGDENQSIFKKFGLSQTEFSVTNESLMITDDIAKNNGLGQNLFDIYSMRSYTLTMTMLGNAMVQPFMYFYLEGVPMFYGLYLVTKVNHRVSANSMETEITAVRMRQTLTKMVDLDTLYHTLYDQIQTSNTGSSTKPISSANTLVGQDLSFSKKSPFAGMINYEITNSTGVMIADSQTEKYGLPETGEFIKEIGKRWYEYANTQTNVAKAININGLSFKNGGSKSVHRTHKIGTSIDIRPVTNDGTNNVTDVGTANYSHIHTKKLIDIIIEVGKLPQFRELYSPKMDAVKIMHFNDKDILDDVRYRSLVTFQPDHSNHIHLEFRLPTKYLKYTIQNGWNGSIIMDSGDYPQDFTIGNKVSWSNGRNFSTNAADYSKYIGFINDINVAPQIKALMEAISYGEGTMGRGNANGYDLLFNNYRIHGYDINTSKIRHRGLKNGDINTIGNWSQTHDGKPTGASGRYQFMYGTWKNVIYNIEKENQRTIKGDSGKSDKFNLYFTKKNQDMACAKLIQMVLKDVTPVLNINNKSDFRAVCLRLRTTWQCFEHVKSSGYNTWDNLYEIYKIALNKYQ